MKTKLLLMGIISVTLLLGACGNDEAEKKDDSKKSESVEKKKEAPKKDESKKDTDKKDNESTEQIEQVTTEEPQSQEQQTVQQEPTEQEKAEANAKVAKEHGYTGIPNGDASFDIPVGEDVENYSNHDGEYSSDVEPEEPSEWVKGQDEWNNTNEAEREEIRKADAEKYGYEYEPEDFE